MRALCRVKGDEGELAGVVPRPAAAQPDDDAQHVVVRVAHQFLDFAHRLAAMADAAEQRQDCQAAAQGRHDVARLLRLVLLHHIVEFLQALGAAKRRSEYQEMLLKRNGVARFVAAARPFNKQCDNGQLHPAHGVCT